MVIRPQKGSACPPSFDDLCSIAFTHDSGHFSLGRVLLPDLPDARLHTSDPHRRVVTRKLQVTKQGSHHIFRKGQNKLIIHSGIPNYLSLTADHLFYLDKGRRNYGNASHNGSIYMAKFTYIQNSGSNGKAHEI